MILKGVGAVNGIESKLERMVDRVFSRASRGGVQPVEIGKRLDRQLITNRSVDVGGRVIAPNLYVVALSADDYRRFEHQRNSLARDLTQRVRGRAEREEMVFTAPVEITLLADDSLRQGQFNVTSFFADDTTPTGPPARLVALDGTEFDLTDSHVIGRQEGVDIVVPDQNVSREHARVEPSDHGWVVRDLGSLNGTKVNGHRVQVHTLREGDRITVGATQLVFAPPS